MNDRAHLQFHRRTLTSSAASVFAVLTALTGCQQQQKTTDTGPDYARQLPAGASALYRITDPAELPDFKTAYRNRDVFLEQAIDQSLQWFNVQSSKQFFPFEGFTHRQGKASLLAMRELLDSATSASEFETRMKRRFNVYQSIGYDGRGTVLFTGYYAPIFQASRQRTREFQYPLYKRPDDLVTDPVTGEPKGRRTDDGSIVPYYTRKVIEQSNMFAGNELVWLKDPLSAYIIHVNGSAKLRLRNGESMYIGYAGKTDRPYTGLGRSMLDAGVLHENELSLSAIKQAYREHPEQVRELIYRNKNYVFFTEYNGDSWPAGSLGAQVTRETTLATDKAVYPRGGLVLVDTQAMTFSRGTRRFFRFMLDQDTGGAIKAPGRADIFMGIGPSAEILAGGQYAEGTMYYLFLKPEYVDEYAPDASDDLAASRTDSMPVTLQPGAMARSRVDIRDVTVDSPMAIGGPLSALRCTTGQYVKTESGQPTADSEYAHFACLQELECGLCPSHLAEVLPLPD